MISGLLLFMEGSLKWNVCYIKHDFVEPVALHSAIFSLDFVELNCSDSFHGLRVQVASH